MSDRRYLLLGLAYGYALGTFTHLLLTRLEAATHNAAPKRRHP